MGNARACPDLSLTLELSSIPRLYRVELQIRSPAPALLRALALLLALWACLPALAQPRLQLDSETQSHRAWPHVRVLPEQGAALSVQEAWARLEQFAPPGGPSENLGLNREPVWVHIPLELNPNAATRWAIDIAYPAIARADLYVLERGQVLQHAQMGGAVPFAERPLRTRNLAAPLTLRAGSAPDLLLRVDADGPAIFPVVIVPRDDLFAHEAGWQFWHAWIAGIYTCALLYSLMQWASLREPIFLYYAISLFGMGFFPLSYYGFGTQHLWSESLWLTRNAPLTALMIGIGGAALFVDRAMQAPTTSPLLSRGLRGVAYACIVTLACYVVGLISAATAMAIALLLGPILTALTIPVAIMRLRMGDRAGGYMLLGWGVLGASITLTVLTAAGALPATAITLNALFVGSTFEMAVWMMVLGVRADEARQAAESLGREHQHMQALAHTDPMTGTLNRRGLQLRGQVLVSAPPDGQVVAIYVLDLDGFKPINDRLGHAAGDALLINVAQRLTNQVRADDLVCRLGGDEFVIIVGGLAGEAEALSHGERLLRSLTEPFVVRGERCTVGSTIGLALAPVDGTFLPDLLDKADRALYEGKQRGRGRLIRWKAPAQLRREPVAEVM